jgi:hypothetical protein
MLKSLHVTRSTLHIKIANFVLIRENSWTSVASQAGGIREIPAQLIGGQARNS